MGILKPGTQEKKLAMYKIWRHYNHVLCGFYERTVYYMALDFASIGLRIRHARTNKKLTQDQLAEAVGISRKHVSLIESGDRGVSLELLINISNELRVPISELLADNLTSFEINDDDLHYILLDSTERQEKIITKMAKALKTILLENDVY